MTEPPGPLHHTQPAPHTTSVPWDTLRPHPGNARYGDVDAIMDSVLANGVYRPIITAQDGTILAGHHLYEALGNLHHDMVTVITLPIDPNSTHALRILAADNRTADLGTYDHARLLGLLLRIDSEASLLGTGYDADDLLHLANKVNNPPTPPPQPPTPEPPPAYGVLVLCADADEQQTVFDDLCARYAGATVRTDAAHTLLQAP